MFLDNTEKIQNIFNSIYKKNAETGHTNTNINNNNN